MVNLALCLRGCFTRLRAEEKLSRERQEVERLGTALRQAQIELNAEKEHFISAQDKVASRVQLESPH